MLDHNTILKATIDIQSIESVSIINHQIWFWTCIIQFILLVVLLYKLFYKKPAVISINETNELKKALKNEVNMHALMDSITKSGKLYKQLSKKCHPDRFVNNPKQKMAEEIFKEITRNKRNYGQLVYLRTRAINELNINF